MDSPHWIDNTGYEWGLSVYFSLSVIAMFTIVLIIYEVQRRQIVSLLNRGYYFVEEFVTLRKKRLVPVAPDNIDASDPTYPKIINPALIQRDCVCCL